MRDKDHDESMAEIFREEPSYALDLLNSILEDDEATVGELLIVLRQMAKAHGGVQAVAEKAELNPTQLYRTLSAEGNPSLSSFTAILKAMNLCLEVKAISPATNIAKAPERTRKKPARAQVSVPAKVKTAQ